MLNSNTIHMQVSCCRITLYFVSLYIIFTVVKFTDLNSPHTVHFACATEPVAFKLAGGNFKNKWMK